MDEFLEEDIPKWEIAPPDSELNPGEIHIWGFHRGAAGEWQELSRCLSEEETQRARRLLRVTDRSQFALSRAGLRRLLSHYLRIKPEEIAIRNSSAGRPELADENRALAFSLAHSGEWTLYALRKKGKIGIDVESEAGSRHEDKLASRYFSTTETKWLKELGDSKKNRAFLILWTLKEAYLKAIGEGIAHGLDKFSVEWNDANQNFLLNLAEGPASDWRLESFAAAPRYPAGLAFDSPPCRVRYFRFQL